jgi:hypothetical protein
MSGSNSERAATGANALFVIHAYRLGAVWAFDDPARGLHGEPFVSGMTEMIDFAARHALGDSGRMELTLVFSRALFPGASFRLVGEHHEAGGRWYGLAEPVGWNAPGWLCPAAKLFFGDHPDELHGSVSA